MSKFMLHKNLETDGPRRMLRRSALQERLAKLFAAWFLGKAA